MKKIPETKEEWMAYDNKAQGIKKRSKEVVELNSDNINDFTYVATSIDEKHHMLGSDSLINLKKEIKYRRWRVAHIVESVYSPYFKENLYTDIRYEPRY